jgi:aryl-alcohol dehydrogenase-like predicted oxidoreductase
VRKRPLADTGIEVSELALGTWGLSGDAYGPVRDDEVDRVIDRAVTLGITLFDTANVYGRGDMERKLGKRLPGKTTHVITKVGTNLEEGYPVKQFDRQHLREAFERSQERLKRHTVDVLLLHNPSAFTLKQDEPFELLEDLEKKGMIIAWGVSAGSAEVARRAIERGAKVVELAYNCFLPTDLQTLIDELEPPAPEAPPAEATAPAAEATAPAGEATGEAAPPPTATEAPVPAEAPEAPARLPAFIARSVLAHGLLAGQWSAEREFYPGDHRAERWNADELRRRVGQLNALRPVVGGDVPSMRAVALRYVLSNPKVTSAVLGPRSTHQLDQLVREAGREPPYLTGAAMTQLTRRLSAVGIR